MHVTGPAIPSTYVNFTTVELNTVSLQGHTGLIWHFCPEPLEIRFIAVAHLPRPSSNSDKKKLSQWSLQERFARRQASVQHVLLVARIDEIQLWFVSQPDNEQPFRKRKYDRSGHPLLYLAETTPLPVPIKSCKHGSFSLFCCYIRSTNIVHIFMDPAMSASAIAMQHRAPQACQSCRKLKRKCVFNPTLGICNRCSETGKPCVYAEVNSAASHDDSVAVVHHNTSTNADASGHLDASLHQGNLLYLDTFDVGWLGSPTADMGPGSGDMTGYPPTHPGGQN